MSEQEYPYCDFVGAYAKIYTLSDENGNIFYVGCTTMRLETRLAQHISSAKNNHKYSNKRKNEIIRRLEFKIIATIVDMKWVTGRSGKSIKYLASDLEKEWINKYLELGYELVNGRLPIIKKEVAIQPEFVGKTLASSPKKPGKNGSWIKIETGNPVKA